MDYLILPENTIDELYEEHGSEVLDACYRCYDSELRRENLTQPEIRAFFEEQLQARPYLEGSVASYNYDDEGITTMFVSKHRPMYGNRIRVDGFVIIRNLEGTYDIHEFWGEEKAQRQAHNQTARNFRIGDIKK